MPLKLLRHALPLFSGSPDTVEAIRGDYASASWSPSARCDARTRKRRSQYFCQIDVSALLTIFLILFVTLVTQIPSGHVGVSVDLPTSDHSSLLPAALREDAMRISILRDGRAYLGLHRIAVEDLPVQIREALRAGAENRVYLSADRRARYADVKKALDAVRLAGVEQVNFITESPRR
jgi:biopolymer transport protein TolR